MTAVYHDLAAGDFSQDWTNTALIGANDNWGGVPSIVGLRGDDLTAATGTDPQTVLAPSTVVNVLANQTSPNTVNTGAVGEFEIANPVVALQGSGTADAPHLLLHLNGSGRQDQAPGLSVGGNAGMVGDGNGDGIADRSQPGVLSTTLTRPGAASTSLTLVADSAAGKAPAGSTVEITGFSQSAAPASKPAPMTAPVGTIDFTAALGTAGVAETFSTYVDPALGVNGYWQQDAAGTWINIAGRAYGGQVVTEGNKLRLDFGITDGGTYDNDGLADGVITDSSVLGFMQLSIVGWQPDGVAPGFFFT